MTKKKIQRYYILRIFMVAMMFYYYLTMPLIGSIWFKQTPEQFTQNKDAITLLGAELNSNKNPEGVSQNDSIVVFHNNAQSTHAKADTQLTINAENQSLLTETMGLSFRLLLLGGLIFLIMNLPFRFYLNKKRKGKQIQEKLTHFVKKFIIHVPSYSAVLFLIIFSILHIYMVIQIKQYNFTDEVAKNLYTQYFYISLAASVLSCFFIYLWERHRVHLLYLDCIFSNEELRVSVFRRNGGGSISRRLTVVSLVTVIIPLAIMSLYLYLSLTKVDSLGTLSQDMIKVLMGPYSQMPGIMSTMGNQQTLSGLYYISTPDQIVMYFGIFTGMVVAILFLFFIVKWNAQYVVMPINDLVEKMRLTGRGELDSYCHVKTNDEIGELTQGYNEMSGKLTHYINNLKDLSNANSRFVPDPLIKALGKDKITDVKLGDQIQKEMTILFSDIRSFTSLSEKMTPKETFDFINDYLGIMEPVIRNNHGFIDKYIGDAIMALFEEPRDACNAAEEMQKTLELFNTERKRDKKDPIKIGIGLNTGKLMLGIVGGAGRISGTVISDAVNTASRLEGLTKRYLVPCIISEKTFLLLSPSMKEHCRYIDIVKVRGKKEPVKIFELFSDNNRDRIRFIQQAQTSFDSALSLYLNRQFTEAADVFSFLMKAYPFDPILKIYHERCTKYNSISIPENWNGIAIT